MGDRSLCSDAVGEGRHEALILLGHQVSEEAGMEECERWLRTVIPEVPVEFLPAGEPFHVVQPLPKTKSRRKTNLQFRRILGCEFAEKLTAARTCLRAVPLPVAPFVKRAVNDDANLYFILM